MNVHNAFASIAVKDIDLAERWYENLFGCKGFMPMQGTVRWIFSGGGGVQLHAKPEKFGHCSCTLAVSDIEKLLSVLEKSGIDTSQRIFSDRVKNLIKKVVIVDPDGNHILLAQADDPLLAH